MKSKPPHHNNNNKFCDIDNDNIFIIIDHIYLFSMIICLSNSHPVIQSSSKSVVILNEFRDTNLN